MKPTSRGQRIQPVTYREFFRRWRMRRRWLKRERDRIQTDVQSGGCLVCGAPSEPFCSEHTWRDLG